LWVFGGVGGGKAVLNTVLATVCETQKYQQFGDKQFENCYAAFTVRSTRLIAPLDFFYQRRITANLAMKRVDGRGAI